jgi:hypothetical protein
MNEWSPFFLFSGGSIRVKAGGVKWDLNSEERQRKWCSRSWTNQALVHADPQSGNPIFQFDRCFTTSLIKSIFLPSLSIVILS